MRINNDEITYIESFWTSRKSLIYKDQVCLYKDKNLYSYINGDEEYMIKLEGSLLFGLKAIVLDNKNDILIKEYIIAGKIKWYEYLLTLVFIGFVFYHYFLGAIIGGLGAVINMIVIRQYKNIFLKILFTLLIGLIIFAFIYLGVQILSIIEKNG